MVPMIGLGACSTPAPVTEGGTEAVHVTALYRERIALVPGHTLTVKVSDTSVVDAPAPVLARVDKILDGGPPYTVTLDVPRDAIVSDREYAASAEIRAPDGKLRFTTDTRHRVLTRGAPNSVSITMIGVP